MGSLKATRRANAGSALIPGTKEAPLKAGPVGPVARRLGKDGHTGRATGISRLQFRGSGQHRLPPGPNEWGGYFLRTVEFTITIVPDGSKWGTPFELIQPEDVADYVCSGAHMVRAVYLGTRLPAEADPDDAVGGLRDLFLRQLHKQGHTAALGSGNPPGVRTPVHAHMHLKWNDEWITTSEGNRQLGDADPLRRHWLLPPRGS